MAKILVSILIFSTTESTKNLIFLFLQISNGFILDFSLQLCYCVDNLPRIAKVIIPGLNESESEPPLSELLID